MLSLPEGFTSPLIRENAGADMVQRCAPRAGDMCTPFALLPQAPGMSFTQQVHPEHHVVMQPRDSSDNTRKQGTGSESRPRIDPAHLHWVQEEEGNLHGALKSGP